MRLRIHKSVTLFFLSSLFNFSKHFRTNLELIIYELSTSMSAWLSDIMIDISILNWTDLPMVYVLAWKIVEHFPKLVKYLVLGPYIPILISSANLETSVLIPLALFFTKLNLFDMVSQGIFQIWSTSEDWDLYLIVLSLIILIVVVFAMSSVTIWRRIRSNTTSIAALVMHRYANLRTLERLFLTVVRFFDMTCEICLFSVGVSNP